MKRKLLLMIGVTFVTPLLLFGTVAATEGTSGGTGTSGSDSNKTATTTNTEDNKTTSSDDQTSTSPSGDTQKTGSDDAQALAERLSQRKTELKTKLTAAKEQHIQTVCKNAQTKATPTDNKLKGVATSRTETYNNLVNRLNDLIPKLQAKNIDVTQLQAEIASLKTQIATFNTDLGTYKQAVNDLVAMNCASDPVAFQASLDAARAARDKATADSAAIKTYVNNTLKPTLQQIRDQVAKTEDSAATTTKTTTPTTTHTEQTTTTKTTGAN